MSFEFKFLICLILFILYTSLRSRHSKTTSKPNNINLGIPESSGYLAMPELEKKSTTKRKRRNTQNNPTNLSNFTKKDKIILCLEQALQENRDVEIKYTKNNGETTIRTITPLWIEDYIASSGYSTGYTCVRAYCHLRRANRSLWFTELTMLVY